MYRFIIIFLLFLCSNSWAQVSPKYEFRAVWVATVNNIDWPSKPGLSSEQQKKEAIAILDMHAKNGMNAIIMQVRPASDAFYQSDLEPWSRYLTGTPGKAPVPFYDPLQFWIEECHKRNMEFHAWLNPFRVAQNASEPLAANHIAFKHPEWIVNYGGRLYFDPGLPQTREFVTKVVTDIVSRYDVDAIHFDDYFYPYPLKVDFPDENSFAQYNRGFLANQKAGWRRDNVDLIIRMLSESIKKTKPWVKFGISPFGVWRNKADDPEGSETTAGTTNYDQLNANVLKWQKNGWIDYCLPQLYWQIGHPSVDFLTLSKWWAAHAYNRAMYIGHAVYKLESNSAIPEWREPDQLVRQIQLIRQIPHLGGSAFYSSIHFKRNLFGFEKSLQENLYKYPALVPTMPWIDNKAPESPERFRKRGHKFKWNPVDAKAEMDKSVGYVVYLNLVGQKFDSENSQNIFTITKEQSIRFKPNTRKLRRKYEIRISALDRLHNESEVSKAKVIKL
ncbi:MAG TPA: family 10 glycosylhydrolase [Prolixibacteraceae bacterium]|nr:family 10 glycosylhydrolase [Prolixibacteraceae bacterium]